jgi:hypothetical protein
VSLGLQAGVGDDGPVRLRHRGPRPPALPRVVAPRVRGGRTGGRGLGGARSRTRGVPDASSSASLCIGHTIGWFATMHPLANPYGANGSMDRENHLGWANVVSNGFPILRTFQVNHLHFEPLWPLLSAIAAGFNPDHIFAVFQWQPLVMGFLRSVRGALRLASRRDCVALDRGRGGFRRPWRPPAARRPRRPRGSLPESLGSHLAPQAESHARARARPPGRPRALACQHLEVTPVGRFRACSSSAGPS